MDPAQGETGETGGAKSLTSRLKAKVPHSSRVKEKVLGLKNRIPGRKKQSGEEVHEDSSEYDEASPRDTGSETGYDAPDTSPLSSRKATTDSSTPRDFQPDAPSSNFGSSPAQTGYDSQNKNYVASSPPTSPAPPANDSPSTDESKLAEYPTPTEDSEVADDSKVFGDAKGVEDTPVAEDSKVAESPSLADDSNVSDDSPVDDTKTKDSSPALEDKFQNLAVGESPSSPPVGDVSAPSDRDVQPEQQQELSPPSATETKPKEDSGVPQSSFEPSSIPSTESPDKDVSEKVKDTVAGTTAAVEEKVGEFNDQNPADPNAPSVVTKAKEALGVDKPSDPNAPPLADKAKDLANVANEKGRELGATAADNAAWTKDRVAAQATPTHHDKALSEQVTESLSNLPGAVKEKVVGSTAPSAAPASPSPQPASPGIVDRLSTVMTSLFTSTPKETASPAAASSPPADKSSVPEKVADAASENSTVNK